MATLEETCSTLDAWQTVTVTTTEPLGVRRRVAGEIELDFLPLGSTCELAGPDDIDGTFILIDEHGDEVWDVRPQQFDIIDQAVPLAGL